MASTFSLTGKLGLDSKDFVQGAKKAEKAVGDVADEMEDLPDTAKKSGGDAGNMLGLNIGKAFAAVGVTAMIGKALNDAMDIEAGVDRVEAQFALTADQAEEYGKMGGELYASAWGSSVSEATASIAKVGVRLQEVGDISEDELSAITSQVYAVSDVFGQDFDAVIRSVGNLLKNGLAVDAEQALDLLTVAFQNGNDTAGDLLDTINEYSPYWAQLGIDGDEALGLIQTGFQNGFRDADKLSDLIKEFGIRALTVEAIEAFDALGLNGEQMRTQFGEGGIAARKAFNQVVDGLKNVRDPLEQNRIGTELFGTQWEDVGPKVIDVLDDIEVGLGDVEGASSEMAETVSDNTSAAMEEMKRRVETALADTAIAAVLAGSAIESLALDQDTQSFWEDFQAGWDSFLDIPVVNVADKMWGNATQIFKDGGDTIEEVAEKTEAAARINENEYSTSIDKIADSIRIAEHANKEYGKAQDLVTASIEDGITAHKNEIQAIRDKSAANRSATSAAYAARDAEDAYLESVEDTTAALEDTSLSEREKAAAVRDSVVALDDMVLAQIEEQGVTVDSAEGQRLWKEKMEESAWYLDGPLREEVEAYIARMTEIPDGVTTDVDVDTSRADLVLAEWMSRPRSMKIDTYPTTLRGDDRYRADGGPVAAGVPYVVGERGRELFIPDTNGMVLPADLTSAMFAQSAAAPRPAVAAGSATIANAGAGVTINHYGPNLTASDVSRGFTLARLAQTA